MGNYVPAKSLAEIQERRSAIYKLMAVSAGIDIVMSVAEVPLIISSFGAELIIDELIETVLSSLITRSKMKINLKNRVVGFIPIPGVTATVLQGFTELWNLKQNEKQLTPNSSSTQTSSPEVIQQIAVKNGNW